MREGLGWEPPSSFALKFIASSRPSSEESKQRFLLEARSIAKLARRNVVSVFRIGEVEGRPYIAYELVSGRTLDRLPRPMPWATALRIATFLARGLDAAHRAGVVHRDVVEEDVPSIRARRPDVPQSFADIVDRCVRRHRLARWHSATELGAALEEVYPVFLPRSGHVEHVQLDDQAHAVAASYTRVLPRAQDFTARVYEKLFAADPSLRALFPDTLDEQAEARARAPRRRRRAARSRASRAVPPGPRTAARGVRHPAGTLRHPGRGDPRGAPRVRRGRLELRAVERMAERIRVPRDGDAPGSRRRRRDGDQRRERSPSLAASPRTPPEEMYGWVGECLLAALAEGLGDDWTPAVEAAWSAAFGAIAGAMIEGAREEIGSWTTSPDAGREPASRLYESTRQRCRDGIERADRIPGPPLLAAAELLPPTPPQPLTANPP